MNQRFSLPLFALALGLGCAPQPQSDPVPEIYFPDPGDSWIKKTPEELGMSSEGVDKAIATAKQHAAGVPMDPAEMMRIRIAEEPHNDVRVNRLSLSLLRLWKRRLPDVLKEYIMDPIDASDTWQWHGYRNSEVDVGGEKMLSVSGGGHWGGGVWMSTRDLARFGYLHLRRGKWEDQQLLSEAWIDAALVPCEVYPDYEYGYMWWVNTEGKNWPRAPRTSFAARGAGSGIVWVDPENDLVFVLRWFDWTKGDEILYDLVEAIKRPADLVQRLIQLKKDGRFFRSPLG